MRILVIQGHPDSNGRHFDDAIATAYTDAARNAGHELRTVTVAQVDFPILRSREEWEKGEVPPGLRQALDDILWAEHLVFVFPLWLGDMPALLKGFLEQVLRPGPAVDTKTPFGHALKGRSARVIVTMGMPELFYQVWYGARAIKSFRSNILNFVGIRPVRLSYFGMVEGKNPKRREAFLARVQRWGGKAA
ncbi:MAG: flavodoxin family protein [Moraxellaceae bacterium]|jgi:putative NADPH-quinone reductase|nr:flavodoxin family protein [Moraxellaceae bacterium]